MNNTFAELQLSEPLLKAIEDLGYEAPTEVQQKSIPHILSRKDLIVRSKTGSGKTAAFGLPMLQSIDSTEAGPLGLILTPTRELAVQIDSDLKLLSKYQPIKTTAVYGQHNINVEMQALEKGVSIVTGTPGRVYDHIGQKTLKTSNIRYLVIDEADKMLDMGFIDQVVRIIKTLPKNRVTLLFSATMPTEIQHICRTYMKDPITIEIESDTKTVDSISQIYHRVDMHEKRTQLHRILAVEQPESCIIFCNTRFAVDKVQEYLSRKGYPAQALHGAISQSSRLKTILKFKDAGFQLLVATDVAARGIHVDDLALVINYDVPIEKDSYVHRIGRTGRAGQGGRAITLVTSEDIMSLYDIEEHVGVMISEEDLPSDEAVKKGMAEYAGKWAHYKPQFHQERLHDEAGKRDSRHGSKPYDKKKPMAKPHSKPETIHKPKIVEPVKVRHTETKATTVTQKPVNSVEPKQQVAAQKPKVAVAKQIQQKPKHQPVSAPNKNVRAYSPDEVASMVKQYQAKKEGKVIEKKPSFIQKILKVFK